MCMKCVLKAILAAEEERLAAEAPTAPGASGQTQAAEPVNLEGVYDLAELENLNAQTRSIDADTILKLANAAKALYSCNLPTDGVIRTMNRLLVQTVEVEPAATEPAPETPASDELPPELVAHIAELKAAGYDVDVLRIEL